MSVVLYALGVALLVWGGYVLLTGDLVATLDIAATLMGYGAFAIGLGAITGAITRLARTIAAAGPRPGAEETSVAPAETTETSEPTPLPARRRAPPPIAAPAPAVEREPVVAPEPYVAPEPVVASTQEPAPRVRPRIEIEPPVRIEPAAPVEAPPVPVKAERRPARPPREAPPPRPADPAVEAPLVVSPILGGGFSRREPVLEPIASSSSFAIPEAVATPVFEQPEPEPALDPILAAEPEPVFASAAEPDVPSPLAHGVEEPAAEAPVEQVAPPEPKVPDWLARARARREARAATEHDGDADAEAADVSPTTGPIVANPAPADTAGADMEPATVGADDTARAVLREGEHNGVLYRFFGDGSVEAESAHGTRRFASLEDLRATILAVRGRIDDDDQPEAEPGREAELMVERLPDEAPAGAVAPVAPRIEAFGTPPSPNHAPPVDDFEAALAALEGRSDEAAAGFPSLADIRPSR